MQTLREIRDLLSSAALRPNRRLGQNFLVDRNLMGKLLELSAPRGRACVLEVGAATGSLTEELLDSFDRVVAVEIDRRMCELLRNRLVRRANLTVICGDVLAGKHRITPGVVEALGERADLVSNLPYNIATPLIALCMANSWRSQRQGDFHCENRVFRE